LGAVTGSEYWRIYDNFKVIKKYNNSNKYAMAVHQLAQAIRQRYN
jgi:membrane-bound lytic murein transglycosylase B